MSLSRSLDGYDPEFAKMMCEARDSAWKNFDPPPRNETLAKERMETAITKAVRAGVREPKVLVRAATAALSVAIKLDPDNLDGEV
jgi:hypothetical protein